MNGDAFPSEPHRPSPTMGCLKNFSKTLETVKTHENWPLGEPVNKEWQREERRIGCYVCIHGPPSEGVERTRVATGENRRS